jgi:hypothetical protein
MNVKRAYSAKGGVDIRMTMIAAKLKSVGYQSHQIGKWLVKNKMAILDNHILPGMQDRAQRPTCPSTEASIRGTEFRYALLLVIIVLFGIKFTF